MKKIKGIRIFTFVLVGLGLLSLIVALAFSVETEQSRGSSNTDISANSYKEYILGSSDSELTEFYMTVNCQKFVDNGTMFVYITPNTGATGASLMQFYDGGTASAGSYYLVRSCDIQTGYQIRITYDILIAELGVPPKGPIRVIVIPVDLVNNGLIQETVDLSVNIDATWKLEYRITIRYVILVSGLALSFLGLAWGFVQFRKNQDN